MRLFGRRSGVEEPRIGMYEAVRVGWCEARSGEGGCGGEEESFFSFIIEKEEEERAVVCGMGGRQW